MGMQMSEETITLWRPVGPRELELIQGTGMREFPPRLPGQPIFYPVLSEEYAVKIARDWNVPASGSGYVTRFKVKRSFIERYDVQEAGGRLSPRVLDTSRRSRSLQLRNRRRD